MGLGSVSVSGSGSGLARARVRVWVRVRVTWKEEGAAKVVRSCAAAAGEKPRATEGWRMLVRQISPRYLVYGKVYGKVYGPAQVPGTW